MTTSTIAPVPDAQTTPKVRLAYLDGLRGMAALYVVAYHLYIDVAIHTSMPWYLAWLGFGHAAVGVFIVLSGYSLMLPVARSETGQLAGGLADYIRRRARRILPPYYAALILTLLCALLFPVLTRPSETFWAGESLPMFTPGILLSHFLLIHNLSSHWIWKISGPFWSVATEWQIYFVFPLLLLPVWRRFGNGAALAVAFALGWILGAKLGNQIFAAYPIFIGLFACGMVAAVLSFPRSRGSQAVAAKAPWGVLVLVFSAAAAFFMKTRPFTIWPDVAIGFAGMALLLYCTRAITERPDQTRPLIVRLLESRSSVFLGHFSYSLYLVHFQVIAMVHLALIGMGCSIKLQALLLPLIAFPASLAVAYGFHRAFELPFMSSKKQAVTLR
jgi:peptidoglycan/LPS O-acetylase OafA/YrhL